MEAEPKLVEPLKTTVAGVVREVAVPALAGMPVSGSLGDLPFENARQAPHEPVLARKEPDGTWRDVTAAEFAREVLAVAKGLIAEGLQEGDRLAIMARTTYEWTLLDFAGWAAGLVTVPIYPTSSALQARWIIHDSGAVACAVEDTAQARIISAERANLPWLAHLWEFDTGAVARLVKAGEHLPDAIVHARRSTRTPQSVATLVYTSGTTGQPKGCVLTHANFYAEVDNAVELLHPVFKSVSEDPASTLLFLPLSHIFGRMVAVGCLRARVKLGHAPSITTEDLLADLAGFQPTFLLAIPYVLEKVYNTARATAEKMGKGASFDRASRIAQSVGEAQSEGRRPPMGTRAAHALYDPLVYRRVRAALGGRVRYVLSGGSPSAGASPPSTRAPGSRSSRATGSPRRPRPPPSPRRCAPGSAPSAGRCRGRRCASPTTGRCCCAGRTSSPATGTSPRSSPATGWPPGTSASSTRTGTSPSPAARRT